LAHAEAVLAKARRSGNSAVVAQAKENVEVARRRLAAVLGQAVPGVVTTRRVAPAQPKQPPSPWAGEPSQSGSPVITADPDAETRTVWIFASGASFHRRDCHVVEGRSGARKVAVSQARELGLARCLHCAPDVR
jgi:hypothetical protein